MACGTFPYTASEMIPDQPCDGVNLSEKIVLISLCSYLIYLGSESVSQERCSCFAIGFVGLGLTGSK